MHSKTVPRLVEWGIVEAGVLETPLVPQLPAEFGPVGLVMHRAANLQPVLTRVEPAIVRDAHEDLANLLLGVAARRLLRVPYVIGIASVAGECREATGSWNPSFLGGNPVEFVKDAKYVRGPDDRQILGAHG